MPTVNLPDPREVARAEAERINADRFMALDRPLERVMIDAPFLEREALLEGLEAFHKERMSRVPPTAKYPESKPWVEHILKVDSELQSQANLTGRELAMLRSLYPYLRFRGIRAFHAKALKSATARDEKCRAAFIPHTDHGRVQFKNLDDPATHWKPEPKPTWHFAKEGQTLFTDGVGSGLHIDEEPDDIFPLNPQAMFRHYCDDTPSSVEFLTRYCPFWHSANFLIYDTKDRSVAIEKCSAKHIEVYQPDKNGVSYISGMTCRDPNSKQGAHQRKMRDEYCKMFGLPDDGPDRTFWATAWKFEQKLASLLKTLTKPAKLADITKLFITPWPEGLNKTGARIHKDQGLVGYTLAVYLYLRDKREVRRWQRTAYPELKFPETPEVFTY